MVDPNPSILDSTKLFLGLPVSYTPFDADVIMLINAALATCTQLGVGPPDGFAIEDSSATWSEFIFGDPKLNAVRDYVHLDVKLGFDIASLTGPVINSLEKRREEVQWRIMIAADPIDNTNIPDDDDDLVIDGGGP